MISDTKRDVLRLFAEGRELYTKRQFREALIKFKEAYALDPSDGPSKVFGARCKHFIENPPPEGWDGVFEMKTK
ncbi:MAG: tetratricopeptide repeat protein [Spirochaetales bacterium]|nr:tetratricopeptide repeat protein [Spirochaetales bacterium]